MVGLSLVSFFPCDQNSTVAIIQPAADTAGDESHKACTSLYRVASECLSTANQSLSGGQGCEPIALQTRSCLVGAAGLTGCALSPEPLHPTEIADLASDAVSRIDAHQEPVDGPIDLYEAMARAIKYKPRPPG